MSKPGFLCLMLLCLLNCVAPSSAQAQEMPAAQRLSVAGVVLAIVDYTRWPETGRPTLLCTTLGGAQGQALFEALPSHALAPRLAIRAVPANQAPPTACDVLLFEAWDPALQNQQLRALADRPVLSIGLKPEFCSNGGAVCLNLQGSELGFEINTDAVARAGLRVNPRVLQLTRSKKRVA